MKRLLVLPVAIFLFYISLFAWDDGADSFDSLMAKSKNYNVPVIVYVRVNWCPWCKKMDAALDDSKIDQLFRNKQCVKINPEDGEAEKVISKKLGVKGYPSIFVIKPNGYKIKLHLSGLGTDNNKLYKTLKKQMDNIYKKK